MGRKGFTCPECGEPLQGMRVFRGKAIPDTKYCACCGCLYQVRLIKIGQIQLQEEEAEG